MYMLPTDQLRFEGAVIANSNAQAVSLTEQALGKPLSPQQVTQLATNLLPSGGVRLAVKPPQP